jgi:hypothetical protein
MKERRKASPGRPSIDILLTNSASYTDRARQAGYLLAIYQTGRRDAHTRRPSRVTNGSPITLPMMFRFSEEHRRQFRIWHFESRC